MKKLFIVASTKGGVSKSFMTRLTYETMVEKWGKDKVILVDCDHRVQSTFKTYPDIALRFDLTSDQGRQKLAELGEECGDKNILIDFAGGSLTEIQELMRGQVNGSLFFDIYKDLGFEITVIVPFTYELNSQLAFKDIHEAYGDAGINVDYFFVQNLKGITNEKEAATFFQGYDGSLENIENHKYLKDFVPQDYAIEKMGLDVNTLDKVGTTSNLMRIPQMPGNLAIWVHDAVKFKESEFAGFKTLLRISATTYFNDIKNRLLLTNLLK